MNMINRLVLSACIIFLSGCSALETKESGIPTNLDEAIIQLKTTLSEDDLNEIKNGTEEDLARLHHGFGTGLRNSWGLWSGSSLARWFNGKGIHHPDDMSGIIILSLYRDLRGVPRELDEQIAYYQAYWKEVEEDEAREKKLDLVRAERVKDAMLQWQWKADSVPEAVLPRRIDSFDVWGLEPYNGGFLVVAKKYRKAFNPIWHDGIYYLASPVDDLKPVRLSLCPEVHDVVVDEGVANWLCKEAKTGWSIIVTAQNAKPMRRFLENAPDKDWLRLGKGESGLLVISPDSIYRENAGHLTRIYTAPSSTRKYPIFDQDEAGPDELEYFLPQRGKTALEHNGAIYFQVEDWGNSTDLYRLKQGAEDLEGLDRIFVYDYFGNWLVHVTDIAVGNEGELWIGTPRGVGKQVLLKLSKEGGVGLAPVIYNLPPVDSDEQIVPADWKMILPTNAIHFSGNIMYLAGGNGIAKVENNIVTPLVYFTHSDPKSNYDFRIVPQRLGLFGNGSFVIGDGYDGVYVLRKHDGKYEFRLTSVSNNRYLIK